MATIVANFISSISTRRSGDFASKMWVSYVQLNPGVYSEALATEFKRRMKPDYVDSAGVGYYYNTFGPSGLNKTTADWIYLLTTSGNIVSRTIIKSGNLLKWNLDGVTVTQNSLPAYTKGTNAGIITMTSTDGWSGVTTFTIHANLFYGSLPSFRFFNVTDLEYHLNSFNGNAVTFLEQNKLIFYVNRSSSFTGISTQFGSNTMSIDDENGNLYSSSMVNSRLAYYNAMFAATPPIKNLTLNLSGATMGIPTGAGSNTDLLGILAKFTAAGFTATIIVRTV
jgi:hypothetical protein